MPVERSPHKNPIPIKKPENQTNNMEMSEAEKTILAAVQESIKTTRQLELSINNKLDHVLDRITVLEEHHSSMERRISALENNTTAVFNDITESKESMEKIQSDMKSTIIQIKEEQDRSWRRNNVVFLGIPETDDGFSTAQQLISFLLPHANYPISQERVGKPNAATSRPIRIYLPNKVEKQTMMSNCKNLKNRPEFEKISVRPDLTKQQQVQRKTPVATRSQVTYRKRTRTEHIDDQILTNTSSNIMDEQ